MFDNSPLQTRAPAEQTRDLSSLTIALRSETINDDERSIEATISTDQAVEVFDWRSGEVVSEVLLGSGADLPRRMPLLGIHNRWTLDGVLGSARDLRREGENLVARLFFARDNAQADSAWNLVRQGHLTDVSVGYRVNESTQIPSGQTATVAGRSYTAGKRALRVATRWSLKEVSVVPIGADSQAKVRELSPFHGANTMHPELRKYLENLGLRAEATEAEAQAYYLGLNADQRAAADKAIVQVTNPPVTPPPLPQTPTRSAPETAPPVSAEAAIAAERNRVRAIRQLAGTDVPAEIRDRAIDEGWDENRASREFLLLVREQRTQAVGPAIHSYGRDADTTQRSLAAAAMMTHAGVDRTGCVGRPFINGRGTIASAPQLTEQDVEAGRRMGSMSALDLVRMCAMIDTGRMIMDPEEAMRAAVSGGTLAYAFTTSAYVKLMQGWDEITDTTDWCETEDVANYLTHEDISLAAGASLEQLPRGGTAKDATMSDSRETYKVAANAEKFSADGQDVIDDRLGAIFNMPVEMGKAAARLRPDLVYSVLLANAPMADTGLLFNATAVATAGGHANLTTAVLGSPGLKAAILAMGKYRDSKSNATLNIRPRFLIVPMALKFTAMELLNSVAQAYTAAAAAATPSNYMTVNILAAENLALRVDDRIGAGGVSDPRTKPATARTGLDTNWFLAAGGSRGIKVAYLRGTNRQPQLRSYTLDKGQWGIGWDLKHTIGAAAMDFKGIHKSTGAG
ncbi:MAG: HK97 family phage prohead protease [Phycisphaerae bacterium]|nr:HK97 family phage prohead protease [Phycisphaerae bacterium]